MNFYDMYDERENHLIWSFSGAMLLGYSRHEFLGRMSGLSNGAFISYLLERGHISEEFVKWNERAKLGMESEEAREIVRKILRDEIPAQGPTHQDDRIYDLEMIGVSKEKILNHRPSWWTRWTIRRLYRGLRYPQSHYDLRTVVFLRMAGEILVGETYAYVWSELTRRFELTPEQSRFYYPHYDHDHKRMSALDSQGHTEVSTDFLKSAIINSETLSAATAAADNAFRIVYQFHNQFLLRYWFL